MSEELTEEQKDKLFDQALKSFNKQKEEDTGTISEEEQSKEVIADTPPEETSGEVKAEEQQPVEKQPEEKNEEPKEDPRAFLESLAPEIKEKVLGFVKERDEAVQRDQRLRGQISGLDRKLQQERLARAEAERKATAAPKAPSPEELPQELKELAEVDPNLAKALEAHARLVETRIRQEMGQVIKTSVEPMYEADEARRQREMMEQVDTYVPNWQQIVLDVDESGRVKTNEQGQPQFNRYWQDFAQTLPEDVRKVAFAPKSFEEVKWSMEQYNHWAQQFHKPAKQEDHSQADAVQRKRELDMKKTPVRSPVTPAPAREEIDWNDEKNQDLLFKEALKNIAKPGSSKFFK